MTLVYFGDPWEAPALENAISAETPVGAACHRCGEFINRGDRGYVETLVHMENDEPAASVTQIHAECRTAEVYGHLLHICACTGHLMTRAVARRIWDQLFDDEGRSIR